MIEPQTRIGIGAAAVFAYVTWLPFVWWISGPIMVLCAMTAAWGFWPVFCDVRFPSFCRTISLRDASRKLYEELEGTDYRREYDRDPNATEDDILDRVAAHFLDGATLEARRPLSTKWERLAPAQQEKLMSRGGATGLGSLEGDDIAFTEPRLRRKDFRRGLREVKNGSEPGNQKGRSAT